MWTLISIGLLAGLIAGVSPCILPVLPVLFFAGGSPGAPATAADRPFPRGRPLIIVAGVVLSFSVLTLLGSAVLSALHLPSDLLRWAALVVLLLIGLGLLLPRLEQILQTPFRRLPTAFTRRVKAPLGNSRGSAIFLGLGLGALFVPCAGPVLAAISIAGTTGRVTGSITALTIAFAVGVAVPMLLFVSAGAGIARRLSTFRRYQARFRMVGGATMILLAVALSFNLTDGLQRTVPNYTQALQNGAEDNPAARAALRDLNDEPTLASTPPTVTPPSAITPAVIAPAERPAPPAVASSAPSAGASGSVSSPSRPPDASSTAPDAAGPVVECRSQAKDLANCGPAPAIGGIESWLNTTNGQPVTLSRQRGKVVLVNFWTFSCINCQRALPFINSWYAKYHASGLEVVGIHTPEFAYEHERGNVADAIKSDDIRYPVALDNSSATWRAYSNSFWPAAYLVDSQGVLRHVAFGEGGYADSELLIRELLRNARPGVALPPPADPTVPIG